MSENNKEKNEEKENKVIELFGINKNNKKEIKEAIEEQLCPYLDKKCTKTRKSNPETSIGTCVVKYQDKDIIICPHRLTENNQIFIDCFHLLTLHEPGNELYLIPEVSIPGGHVDYFLVSAKNKKVKDFVGIELQTLDTTGTVWPERQRLLKDCKVEISKDDTNDKKGFSINWKMTTKTILMQMHHKSETFEYINKHLVLIIQDPLLNYMKKEFSFDHISGVRLGDPVHIHSYGVKNENDSIKLELNTRLSTDALGIAKSLNLNVNPKVELAEIIELLEDRLSDDNRLKIF